MEKDVEADTDAVNDLDLIDVVVSGVDYAQGSRPALLGRTNGSPKNAFAATAGVALLYSQLCL